MLDAINAVLYDQLDLLADVDGTPRTGYAAVAHQVSSRDDCVYHLSSAMKNLLRGFTDAKWRCVFDCRWYNLRRSANHGQHILLFWNS